MEEVLIDDNMVFDIDNLKGFLNDTSSFGFIAKENNKIIGFAYCYTLLRPDGKTMFYLHSIGMLPNYQDKGYGSKLLSFIIPETQAANFRRIAASPAQSIHFSCVFPHFIHRVFLPGALPFHSRTCFHGQCIAVKTGSYP